MGYTDAQGRPEIVANPDLVRGGARWRFIDDSDDDAEHASMAQDEAPAGTACSTSGTPIYSPLLADPGLTRGRGRRNNSSCP